MAIGLNPGQPMASEIGLYAGLDPQASARGHLAFVESCFLAGNGKRFHQRLLCWLSDLLELPHAEVFRHTVYTNLVKCTTYKNRAPRVGLIEACFREYLRYEIELWRPGALVALGGHAYEQLRRLDRKERLGVRLFKLPHPSHRRSHEYHRSDLETLRSDLTLPSR